MTSHYRHLSAEDRGAIMAMSLQRCSARLIGRTLCRAPSSISRELRRNGYLPDAHHAHLGRPRIAGGYDAVRAGARARRMRRLARRPRKLCQGSVLWGRVRSLLQQFWSPQQIAGILRRDHPQQAALQASHETIYTAIYARPKGELRKELTSLLRQSRDADVRSGQGDGASQEAG